MAKPKPVPVERIQEMLDYDPETGHLTWKVQRRPQSPVGSRAGCRTPRGYMVVGVDGVAYQIHRVAAALTWGDCTSCEIDHINGDFSDNRIANLRRCTRSENNQNMPLRKHNKTGFPGVSWNARFKKYQATIALNKRSYSLGYCRTAEEAGAAYVEGKRKLHTFAPEIRAS